MIDRAEAFARRAHAGHMRKGALELPYTAHLEEVAEFVSRHGGDDTAVAAAWLHDTVEDSASRSRSLNARSVPRSPTSSAS